MTRISFSVIDFYFFNFMTFYNSIINRFFRRILRLIIAFPFRYAVYGIAVRRLAIHNWLIYDWLVERLAIITRPARLVITFTVTTAAVIGLATVFARTTFFTG